MIRRFGLVLSLSTVLIVGSASAADFPNRGLWFNGVSDYVQLTTGSTVQYLTSSFTVEAWCYPTTASSSARRVISNFQSNPSRGWGMGVSRFNSWRLTTFGVKDYDTSTSTLLPYLNKWTHLAVTLGADNTATFYLNGDYFQQVAHGIACRESTAALTIGNNPIMTEWWQGGLDEVRVWDYVRTPEQLKANYATALTGTEPGLVLYYAMQEATGTALVDRAGQTSGEVYGAQWGPGAPFPPTAAKDWELLE
jgi:hypothetical protein